jgi:16S rRNA (guanine966-N2)-methyltransferase
MPRIVAGLAGGRRIAVPTGRGVRPTADRVREALFSALQARRGGFGGARVLDLYAGSGALGLEALSRGAERALLVESDRAALRALQANVDTVGLAGAEVLAAPVGRLPDRPAPPVSFDVVLADPPYALAADDLAAILARLAAEGWIASPAWLAVERAATDEDPPWPEQVTGLDRRRYGDTALWYGRRS